jgi:hypothetical protein
MTEAEESTTQSKPAEAKKPSWIRQNFFQTCVVLLLAWIGTNLELVVDASRNSRLNAIENHMRSYVDVPVANDPPSLNDVERSLREIHSAISYIQASTSDINTNTRR